MAKKAPSKTVRERQLDAEVRAAQWLADGNQATESGNGAKAEACYAKSQYWLDRANLLAGWSDRPAPKR